MENNIFRVNFSEQELKKIEHFEAKMLEEYLALKNSFDLFQKKYGNAIFKIETKPELRISFFGGEVRAYALDNE
jgi:hypothetical protein